MAVVAPLTLKPDVFEAIEALILANKPTYVYDGTTFTYTLKAAYSRENPDFPQVVLNESLVKIVLLNLDGSGEDYGVEIQLDFYAKERHGQKAIGSGQSQIANTFIGNLSAFNTDNGLIPDEDFWDDTNISPFSDGNQVLNTASSLIKFKLK